MPQSRFLLWPLWFFAAVCFSAPFLVAPHTYPIPTFYAESASAWCWIAFSLVVLGLSWRGRASSPSIALAPLALIVVLIVQLGIATPLNPFFSFAACICLLAAMVVCGLGARCREMPGVLEAVAVGTILGGLATVAVEQVHLWRLVGIPDILIGLPPTGLGRRMWGNLNQPNHVASYFAFGLAACLFLWQRVRSLGLRILLGIVVLAFLFGTALSVSRVAWLHLIAVGLFAGWSWASQTTGRRRWFVFVTPVLALTIAYQLCNWLMDYGNVLWQWGLPTSLGERMQQGAGLRPLLWNHAWHMFIAHPWLGAGWGDYAWNQYVQTDVLGHVEMSMNAHNIVLDLLAKVGLAGLFAVVLPAVGLISLLWKFRMTPPAAFLWSVVAVLTIHSMLEYPLYYLYFLLPFAFALGYLDTRMLRFPSPSMTWVLSGVIVVCVSALSARMWIDYKSVERLYYAPAGLSKELPVYQASGQMLLVPYATLAIAINSGITYEMAAVMAALERQATQFYPGAATSQRYALTLAFQGKTEEAVTQVRRLHNQYWTDYAAQSSLLTQSCLQKADDLKVFCDRLKSEGLLVGVN
ncbi:MAG: O-antigen ligase C-terminal domain-containing protein [Ralstonia pickettii]|nr:MULTISPECIES: O-antigen ligase family protein [Ralstonia]MCL6455604.1 O-antigen ligase C-terminal domain-containing protein [Ralstonia pickettii]OCS45926.1 polymerase [Ralstonia pickettii]